MIVNLTSFHTIMGNAKLEEAQSLTLREAPTMQATPLAYSNCKLNNVLNVLARVDNSWKVFISLYFLSYMSHNILSH